MRALCLLMAGLVGCAATEAAPTTDEVLPPLVLDDHGAGGGKADELLGGEKSDIEQRIIARAPALRTLKETYFIGEGANGFLAVPPRTELDADARDLLCAENQDRDRLYDIETEASLALLASALGQAVSIDTGAIVGAAFAEACSQTGYLDLLGLCGDLAGIVAAIPMDDGGAGLAELVESQRQTTRIETQIRFANFFQGTLRSGERMTVIADGDNDGDNDLCWVPRPDELEGYQPAATDLDVCDDRKQPLCP